MGAVECRCGGDSTVVDSRPHSGSTRRRRKCLKCGLRWSTLEVRGTFTGRWTPAQMREAKRVKAQERFSAAEEQKTQGAPAVQGAQETTGANHD